MVKIALEINANLDNVEELYTNHPNYAFLLKLKCLNCGECPDIWHDVIESKTYPSKLGKSHTHYTAKCKLCGRENSLSIVEGTNVKYTSENQGNFKSIVVFDCRGLEPVEFTPTDGWMVKIGDSCKLFENVDLTDKEWVEYDDKIKQSVGIYDFQSRFIKIK